MAKALIQGYGAVTTVGDEGHQQTNGSANDITDLGLDRLLGAPIALDYERKEIFTHLFLTRNLPTDKDVFTDEELEPYLVHKFSDIPEPTFAYPRPKIATITYRTVREMYNGPDAAYDLISLAYKDGESWVICTRAKSVDPVTKNYTSQTLLANLQISAIYTFDISLMLEEGFIGSFQFDMSRGTMLRRETLGGAHVEYDDPSAQGSATRLPYVDGSFKVRWRMYSRVPYLSNTIRCLGGLFALIYQGVTKTYDAIIEIAFLRPSEMMEKLEIDAVAPTNIVLKSVDKSHQGVDNTLGLTFETTPFSTIYLSFDGRIIAKTSSDALGSAFTRIQTSYQVSSIDEYRDALDGMIFEAVVVNNVGQHTQQIQMEDNRSNSILHWYWADKNILVLCGRLNDKVEVLIDYGYTETGVQLREHKVAEITLTTPNPLYGPDGAEGTVTLNLIEDYKLFHTSSLLIRVTDASGNVGIGGDLERIYQIVGVGIPDLHKEPKRNTPFLKGHAIGDAVVCIPHVIKGNIE